MPTENISSAVRALVADDPFWRAEEPTVRTWVAAEPENLYGGGPVGGPSPGGPPFVIGEGNTLAGATMDNPGDIEAWPVWRVEGLDGAGVTDVVLGVGDRQIAYPGPIGLGQVLTVDTDPLDQQVYLDGVNVTGDLTEWGFAPVPAGAGASLSLSMVGASEVRASIHPKYYRAW